MRSGAWVMRLLRSGSCSTCRCHLDRAKRLINRPPTNECHCSFKLWENEDIIPPVCHIKNTLNHPHNQFMTEFLFSLPGSIAGIIIFGSQWTRVEVSLTEKLYSARGEDYFLIFSNCAGAQVLLSGATVCTLSDWERQACVWLPYHLRLLFASESADWAFLPVSLPELMINYKRACSPGEYRCFHWHTHLFQTGWLCTMKILIGLEIRAIGNEDLLCKLNEEKGTN